MKLSTATNGHMYRLCKHSSIQDLIAIASETVFEKSLFNLPVLCKNLRFMSKIIEQKSIKPGLRLLCRVFFVDE